MVEYRGHAQKVVKAEEENTKATAESNNKYKWRRGELHHQRHFKGS